MVKLGIKMAGWGDTMKMTPTPSLKFYLVTILKGKKSRFVSGSKKETRRSIHTTAQRIY